MEFESWRHFYESDFQSVISLLVAPGICLAYLLLARSPRVLAATSADARFVYVYCVFFAFETLVDPVATGPAARALSLGDGASTGVILFFVLLGDFRVFVLLFQMAQPRLGIARAVARAALLTPAVPVVAYVANALLASRWPEPDPQRLWLVHELLFVALAIGLRQVALPRLVHGDAERLRWLRSLCTYVIAYYALWATSDVLVLYAGIDAGWLLRVVPNQLYYAFWIPFVWLTWGRWFRSSLLNF